MTRRYEQGRRHAPTLLARSKAIPAGEQRLGASPSEGQQWVLSSPTVGMVHSIARPGVQLSPGDAFAKLIQLGAETSLCVPPGAYGQVVASLLSQEGQTVGQAPAAYEQPLVVLDPNAGSSDTQAQAQQAQATSAGGQTFTSPSSGRFYRRPSPDRPPFLEVGQVIKTGQTVGLLEIMKTFTRIQFGGPGLPDSVKVLELLAQDDDELASGDPIFRFESV